MGQKGSTQRDREIDKIESMLCDSYKNSDNNIIKPYLMGV